MPILSVDQWAIHKLHVISLYFKYTFLSYLQQVVISAFTFKHFRQKHYNDAHPSVKLPPCKPQHECIVSYFRVLKYNNILIDVFAVSEHKSSIGMKITVLSHAPTVFNKFLILRCNCPAFEKRNMQHLFCTLKTAKLDKNGDILI